MDQRTELPMCDDCGLPMRARAKIGNYGLGHGARFFECPDCGHSKGVDLTGRNSPRRGHGDSGAVSFE